MAEETKEKNKQERQEQQEPAEKKPGKKDYYSIVRIVQTDIPGNKRLLTGLTYEN